MQSEPRGERFESGTFRQTVSREEETLLGAFFAETGPKPGVEAFSVFAFGAMLILTSSSIAALVVGVAVFAGVALRRRHVLVALTDHGLVEIEGGLRRIPRQGAKVSRSRIRPNLLFADAGDPYATVQGKRRWVRGTEQDEARRLARLASAQRPGYWLKNGSVVPSTWGQVRTRAWASKSPM